MNPKIEIVDGNNAWVGLEHMIGKRVTLLHVYPRARLLLFCLEPNIVVTVNPVYGMPGAAATTLCVQIGEGTLPADLPGRTDLTAHVKDATFDGTEGPIFKFGDYGVAVTDIAAMGGPLDKLRWAMVIVSSIRDDAPAERGASSPTNSIHGAN